MDPKTTANLDPKLKDMYNRVMNTPVPPPVSPSPVQNGPVVPPTTQAEPVSTPMPQPSQPPAQAQDPTPASTPTAPPLTTPTTQSPPPTTEVHAAIPLPVPPKPISAAVVAGPGKNKGLSFLPILLTTGAIIFFGGYIIFWIKFFNLSVPFLPF